VSGAPRFEMRGIRKAFGGTVALGGVDLSVRAGEVCALVGPNGAGKSTLMAILSGALAPDEGVMALEGAPYRPRDPLEARRAGVAMIHQELSLAPHLSVADNIVLGMEPARWGLVRRAEARARAERALGGLQHGEIDPDAPVFDLVRRLRDEGQAVVYISHFLEEVQQVADRFVVLRDGRNAGEGPVAGATRDEIVALMIGRRVGEMFARKARQPGEVVLEAEDLEPGGARFNLRRGEVLGIAGLMGAGRTRLLRTLFGLEPVRAGRVRVGMHSGAATASMRWDQGVGFVSEDRKGEGLAAGLDVADNLTLSRLRGLGRGPLVMPARQEQAARRWIDRLQIRCRGPRQAVAELSGGNQQKVALARLLHHDVDVLLLDEPTRGIDVGSKAQIYELVDALVSGAAGGRAPCAVLVVSSDFTELLGLCDRIAVMCRGRLGAARPASELDEHRLVMEAAGGAA
jgi:ribose transport system ATP-binding protein